jgi:S1-C subfamily serine protease
VPEFPAVHVTASASEAVVDLDWLGGKIHTIANQDEMSVFGAPGIAGAVIVTLPGDSRAAKAGFQLHDLILHFGEANVQTAADLYILTLQVFKAKDVLIEGLRDQRPFKISLSLP